MIGQWENYPTPSGEGISSALKPAVNRSAVVFLTHAGLRLHWEKVLAVNGWPSSDAAQYQLEPKGTKRRSADDVQLA